MKTSRNIISVLIAAGAPGVALLVLSNVIAAETAFAILSVGSILAFAVFDYSRNTASLQNPGRILRPTLSAAKLVSSVACTLDRAA